ncbi:hypothetical protein A4R43_12640 [Amycolatopsis albispora]|uniref:AMP-dependent synthetase/ligase domain-containing protein n=1 Tax=Amycolatopsis albispora TaxID=1804986 RepID=A0A344L5H2_9PSEU|nr:hypothetical protein A4R43_12640 [Amycolatopsis albispora]
MLTPAGLSAGTGRVASALAARGVRPDQVVLLSAANSAGFAEVLLGLMRYGTGIALLSPGRPATELARAAAEAGAAWVISDNPAHRRELGTGTGLLSVAELTDDPHHAGTGARPSFERWAARADGLICWSSGSTGAPKAIVRSGQSVLDNIERTARRMRYRSDDLIAPLLPFSHQYGMSLILLAWHTGASLLIAPHTRPDRALPLLAEHRATVVDATPATYRSVLNLLRRRPALAAALGEVRMWCTGGAPLVDHLRAEFATQTGKPLLDGYGSTELGNIALAGPDAPEYCEPLDGVRVRVTDQRGRALPAGQVGEVWVEAPDVMVGTLVAGTLLPTVPGAFPTNDIGYLDPRFGLRIVGRKKAVHRRGYTLFPDYLAHRAEECGQPVQVVPVEREPDEWRLVFVIEDPARGPAAQWRERFKLIFAPHELPDRIVVLERFPQLATGKRDARRIRELAVANTRHRRPGPAANPT